MEIIFDKPPLILTTASLDSWVAYNTPRCHRVTNSLPLNKHVHLEIDIDNLLEIYIKELPRNLKLSIWT